MADNTKQEFVVGVDLGGTKILAGVFDSSFNCIGQAKLRTKPERGFDAVVERIARCARDAVDECDMTLKQLNGLGIGAPGAVNVADGRVIFAPNLGWKDVPLKADLEKSRKTGKPLRVYLGVDPTAVASLGTEARPSSTGGMAVAIEARPTNTPVARSLVMAGAVRRLS